MFMFSKLNPKQNQMLFWIAQTRPVFHWNISVVSLSLRQLTIPTLHIEGGDAPSLMNSDMFAVLLTAAILI